MSVLGFSSPCFSFGTDIMLPVDTNRQLRNLLLSNAEGGNGKDRKRNDRSGDALAIRSLEKFTGVFVPEVVLVRVVVGVRVQCKFHDVLLLGRGCFF